MQRLGKDMQQDMLGSRGSEYALQERPCLCSLVEKDSDLFISGLSNHGLLYKPTFVSYRCIHSEKHPRMRRGRGVLHVQALSNEGKDTMVSALFHGGKSSLKLTVFFLVSWDQMDRE